MRTGPILCVVGARPNYMKMAPIIAAFARHSPALPALLVHTGQHYDFAMNEAFFATLGMPKPDVNLEVGSGTHAVQTAEIMRRFEPVVDETHPAAVLVVGDVNSTIACALVAAKKGVPVVHVEAGLRSRDRGMPEEINRVLTDQLSELLFTTERSALDNLVREGIDPSRVHFVGNAMIDTLLAHRAHAVPPAESLRAAGVDPALAADPAGYAAVTLHRPSNVDDPAVLEALLGVLREAAGRLPVLFAMHPRTRAKVHEFGLGARLEHSRIALLPPQGYLEMLGLMAGARVVLTDSGGVQEETTALGVPCLTLRNNTERPITAEQGTNIVVGQDPRRILAALEDVLRGGGRRGRVPEHWDGRAGERIARHIGAWLAGGLRAAA